MIQHSRRSYRNRVRGSFPIISLVVVVVSMATMAVATASGAEIAVDYENRQVSLTCQNARVSDIFARLAAVTSQQYLVPETLMEECVSLRIAGTDPVEVVKRIIDRAGGNNYAVICSYSAGVTGGRPGCQIRVVLLGSDAGQQVSFGPGSCGTTNAEQRAEPSKEGPATSPSTRSAYAHNPRPDSVPPDLMIGARENSVSVVHGPSFGPDSNSGEFRSALHLRERPVRTRIPPESKEFPHYRVLRILPQLAIPNNSPSPLN